MLNDARCVPSMELSGDDVLRAFVTDRVNSLVRVLTAGVISTLAGSGMGRSFRHDPDSLH